jgi:hypothetical protein
METLTKGWRAEAINACKFIHCLLLTKIEYKYPQIGGGRATDRILRRPWPALERNAVTSIATKS